MLWSSTSTACLGGLSARLDGTRWPNAANANIGAQDVTLDAYTLSVTSNQQIGGVEEVVLSSRGGFVNVTEMPSYFQDHGSYLRHTLSPDTTGHQRVRQALRDFNTNVASGNGVVYQARLRGARLTGSRQ